MGAWDLEHVIRLNGFESSWASIRRNALQWEKSILVIVREELFRYGFNDSICADCSPKGLHGNTGLRIQLEVST